MNQSLPLVHTMEYTADEEEASFFSSSSLHFADILIGARKALLDFFAKKKLWCGGSIPQYDLITSKNIDILVHTSIVDAVDVLYSLIDGGGTLESAVETADPEWANRFVISFFKEAATDFGIPKYFLGGLLLIYLDFCEGMECLDTLEIQNSFRSPGEEVRFAS